MSEVKDTWWKPKERPTLSKANEEGNTKDVMDQNYLLKNNTDFFLFFFFKKVTTYGIFFFWSLL